MAEQQIGTVTHYFGHLHVAAVQLEDELSVGDTIHIKGHTTDLTQAVDSMQVEHHTIQKAWPGQDVAIRVEDHVREHDVIYKVTD